MIVGIGTDIVHIPRVVQILDKYGERFSRRILSAAEGVIFAQHHQGARYLASRFAAKEACAKAFGTGFRDGLKHADIAVSNDQHRKPMLTFEGKAVTLMQTLNVTSSHISLTDEVEYAIAFVVLERD